MNGDYGERIAPLLTHRQVVLGMQSATSTQILPRNPQRFGVILPGYYNSSCQWHFGLTAPSTTIGSYCGAYAGVAGVIRYCDIGRLIWEPLWITHFVGVPADVIVTELILGQEGWDIINAQSLTRGRQ